MTTDSHFITPPAEPMSWLQQWLNDAKSCGMKEPLAMNLATVNAQGQPSSRIVLFKGMQGEDLSFYTNYQSRKGEQLAGNPQAALCFWWDSLGRQLRLEGRCEKLNAEASDAYFASRPRGSQLGAWASAQSQPTGDRDAMERAYQEQDARFAGQDVPRPPHWGGYAFRIESIEFWQARDNRFHDRITYQRSADGWRHDRLQP